MSAADALLAPPVVTRPADTLNQHEDHWDATRFVTDDEGWTWRAVSGVNFPTREQAQAWLDNTPSSPTCPIHGKGCESWT